MDATGRLDSFDKIYCIFLQAFLTPEFVKQNPDYEPYVEKLKDLIVDQVRHRGTT